MFASAAINKIESNKTASNMKLMIAHSNDLECAICYKHINKYLFVCSAPCSKVFHTTCMEKVLEQTEEAAYEMGTDIEHKCCYCRRSIDIVLYQLQNHLRGLIGLRSRGNVDVSDAVKHALKQIQNREQGEPFEFDIQYTIYEFYDDAFIKKPKQFNRATFSKKKVSTPRIRVKQNIGGRRR
jgi:hypothetical protein